MPVKWESSKYKGVRYYEHPTRKRGVQKDRYYAIRYQKEGKRKEEGLGWASEKDHRYTQEGWPKTGAKTEVGAKKLPFFKVGKELREWVKAG